MKRVTLIFLIFIYAFSTTGISLKAFYCCGKLQSVKFTLADSGKDTEGCCKAKYQSFKVKDTHAATDILTIPALPQIAINSVPIFQVLSLFSTGTTVLLNGRPPPLYNGVPLYISNCIYRI